MRTTRQFSLFILALMVLVIGCQGRPSSKPPIHIVPNMDNQPRFNAQSKNDFFENNSSMRMPVPGTVARGFLREDDALYRGRNEDSSFIDYNPIELNATNLQRGKERYNIYCVACHGGVGDGRSVMAEKGFPPPASYHTDLMRNQLEGYYFDVITNGIRNMPAHGKQISVEDRWKIIHYLRALQLSQYATIDAVPSSERSKLK